MAWKLTLCVALALGLAFPGPGGFAEAQTAVDCPQEIIDALGSDPNPLGCEKWKYGMTDPHRGAGMRMITRRISGGLPNCGAEQPVKIGFGQLHLIEPKDSECTVGPGQDCPLVIPHAPDLLGGAGPGVQLDPAERSFAYMQDRLDFGYLVIMSPVHTTLEGAAGRRIDVGGGQTKVVLDIDPLDNDPNDPTTWDFWPFRWNVDGDALNPVYANRTGDMMCCHDLPGYICVYLGQDLYPTITIPLFNEPEWRLEAAPLLFDGGKGTHFQSDPNYVQPGQIYGVCKVNRDTPCVDPPDPNNPNPCPDLGDVCDLTEPGVRATDGDLDSKGFPLPGCAHYIHVYEGWPNIGCALPVFYGVGENRDPLPLCRVRNFGTVMRVDNNCDGVDDVIPDKCPYIGEYDPFADNSIVPDGRGDECQCGDTDGDGILGALDATNIIQEVQGVAVGTEEWLWDTDYTSASGTTLNITIADAMNVVAVVTGQKSSGDLTCYLHPVTP
jgi:hypothetical protein